MVVRLKMKSYFMWNMMCDVPESNGAEQGLKYGEKGVMGNTCYWLEESRRL